MQAGPGWITGQYQAGQPGCVILMPYSVRVESVDQPLAVRAAMSQPQLHRGRAAMAPPPGRARARRALYAGATPLATVRYWYMVQLYYRYS